MEPQGNLIDPRASMTDLLKASGPVFSEDHLINLYYIQELYQNIAAHASRRMLEEYQIDVPITSGIWGGTYLIADPDGKAKRRIWRLYSIVNLPQRSPLDTRDNLDRLIDIYHRAYISAFEPYGLELSLKMWGGTLPYSCRKKPSFTMHMEDATGRVKWLRAFFIWNHVPWEESIIYDVVRIIKEYKEFFDLRKGPVNKDPKDIKFLLQDIIIIYRTLENALNPDFIEHAEPIIQELMEKFMVGLFEPKAIMDLYEKVFKNALIYGFEEALADPFRQAGLNIQAVEEWPQDKINWVPEVLKEKLIPPVQALFASFKANLEKNKTS